MTTPDPDEYGEIVVHWNGPVVQEAPRRARISLELIASADPRALAVSGSTITICQTTTYRVVGWEDRWLLVERLLP